MARTHYVGLDVGDAATAICALDGDGAVVLETTVASTPAAIAGALKPLGRRLKRVGHEAGPLSPWLHPALLRARLPVVCLDARKTRAALEAQRNKTDRTDARGIAQILALGFEGYAYVKSREAHKLRALLTYRSTLKRKARDLESLLRFSVKTFGGRMERTGERVSVRRSKKDADAFLDAVTASIARARAGLLSEAKALEKIIVALTRTDPVCRRLMTVPGVGPITALAFKAAVDDPDRFPQSRLVASYFGLTPKRFQSGLMQRGGHISKFGDGDVRALLFEAAIVMLTHAKTQSALKTWGKKLAARKGVKVAAVACARKIAVILHRLWVTKNDFDPAH
jgi:transposase